MSFFPDDDQIFASMVEDHQIMPTGLWIVVKIFAMDPDHPHHRMRVLWNRFGRKTARVMRLKPIVLPVKEHKVRPYVANDWVYGVCHKQVYGILLDIDHHGLRDSATFRTDYKIDFQIERIEVLDMLASSMGEERS